VFGLGFSQPTTCAITISKVENVDLNKERGEEESSRLFGV
jgi:hypothetical protein